MELIKAYSFLGRSTGILGHANINNRSRDEGNDEKLVVNSSSGPWEEGILMDDLSKPTVAMILNSEYKKVVIRNLNNVERKEIRGEEEIENEMRSWAIRRER